MNLFLREYQRYKHHLYKIKLRQAGYRLVYEVNDQVITVTVVAIGKREGGAVYNNAFKRAN